MQPTNLLFTIIAVAASVQAISYDFTTCNSDCSATGCAGGKPTTWVGEPGETIDTPSTSCVIWPAGSIPSDWEMCSDKRCTKGTNLNCYASQDAGLQRTICKVPNSPKLRIYS